MEPVTSAVMLVAAGSFIGALVGYVKRLFRKDQDVKVKIGDVEISIKGPISTKQAQDLVHAIGESHALER
jgi:hypothetical protein